MRNRVNQIKILKEIDKPRYLKPIKYPEIPLSIDDIYVKTTSGDRLDLLANQFYGDVGLWWIISLANIEKIKRDSFALKPGIEIRIPVGIKRILKDFEKLNDNTNPAY